MRLLTRAVILLARAVMEVARAISSQENVSWLTTQDVDNSLRKLAVQATQLEARVDA